MTKLTSLKLIVILLFASNVKVFSQNEFNSDSIFKKLPSKFSGQIAIKKHTHFIYKKSFGEKNYKSTNNSFNDSTLFNLGEIEHSFIYYFIEHLEKLGQIKQNDPVEKYLKNFPYPNILISHLLNHQSGLPSSYVKLYHKKWYSDMNIKLVDKAKRFDNDDIIYIIEQRQPTLKFEPGSQTNYSDLNYLLLTSIIEQITFTKYSTFARLIFKHHEFIFEPTISAVNDTIPNKAYGFRYFPTGDVRLFENLNTVGFNYSDGTYGNQHTYLSTTNLALWGQFIIQQLDLEKLKKTNESQFYGGFTYNSKHNCIQITGAYGGTYSQLLYFPKNNIIAIINSNVYTGQKTTELISYLSNIDK